MNEKQFEFLLYKHEKNNKTLLLYQTKVYYSKACQFVKYYFYSEKSAYKNRNMIMHKCMYKHCIKDRIYNRNRINVEHKGLLRIRLCTVCCVYTLIIGISVQ